MPSTQSSAESGSVVYPMKGPCCFSKRSSPTIVSEMLDATPPKKPKPKLNPRGSCTTYLGKGGCWKGFRAGGSHVATFEYRRRLAILESLEFGLMSSYRSSWAWSSSHRLIVSSSQIQTATLWPTVRYMLLSQVENDKTA